MSFALTTASVAAGIFGGCCSNVFSLEKLVQSSKLTNTITFAQFVFISIVGLYLNSESLTRLKSPQVPLKRWLLHVLFFFVSSTLNNYVLSLDVSMPIHVIFRSSGTVFTMIIGSLFLGKKYSVLQALSGVFLTIGLGLTSVGNAGYDWREIVRYFNFAKLQQKIVALYYQAFFSFSSFSSFSSYSSSMFSLSSLSKSISSIHPGIALLVFSSILISINGFLVESTFKSVKNRSTLWKEAMLYQHLLSIPFFIIILHNSLRTEFKVVCTQSPEWFGYLALNLITQYVCVLGVNRLSGIAGPLTISVVLMLRKFMSLVLSLVLFGNKLNETCYMGMVFVFFGVVLYSIGGRGKKKERTEKKSS